MAKPESVSVFDILPYDIEQVSDVQRVGTSGRLEQLRSFSYRTAAGDTGSVTLRKSDATAAAARMLIEQEVRQIAILRGLMPEA